MITVLWREREGRLLPNLLVFPFLKLPAVVLNELSLGAGGAAPAPFLPGLPEHRVRGHGAAVHSPHLLPQLRALLASECGRGVMSPPPASPGGAVIWDSLYWGSTTGEVSFPEWLVTAGPCL